MLTIRFDLIGSSINHGRVLHHRTTIKECPRCLDSHCELLVMRGFLPSLICLVGLVSLGDAASNRSTAALEALVERQLPFHKDQFVFELEPHAQVKVSMKTHPELDTFTLSDGSDGKIHIECDTISACARGLYTYSTYSIVLTADTSRRLERSIYTGLEVG
jgi:hypothetical protein